MNVVYNILNGGTSVSLEPATIEVEELAVAA